MIRYITRHGQVAESAEYLGDPLYPVGECPLSEMGREQALRLGERLKEMGFTGRILSSPYMRTLETAELIAGKTGSTILPFAPIREIFKTDEAATGFEGKTIEQMKALYPHIDPEAELPWPWWYSADGTLHGESSEEVLERVRLGVEELEARFGEEELLLVGHGASTGALVSVYEIPKKGRTMRYNCGLCAIDPADPAFKPYHFDVSHLPYELQTNNRLTHEEWDAEYFTAPYEEEIPLPEGIESIQGKKILHIGDTFSVRYPYYRKLVEVIRPDIILHTGDMVDEVKVGRIPGTEYEYLSKLKFLLDVMNESGARLIIVPGNNDLPDEIHRLCPRAEIYPENTEIEFDGVSCRIGHMVHRMTFDKAWSFYGHGFTGETWSLEQNVPGVNWRFNVKWGSFVYCIGEGKAFCLPLPKM